MRVAHLESGCGWVPYWMERMDEHFETLGYTVPRLQSKPSEHLTGGRCFVSFEADEALLPAVAAVLGDTQLVYTSDYPHYDCDWEALDTIVDRGDITDAQEGAVPRRERPTALHPARLTGPAVEVVR